MKFSKTHEWIQETSNKESDKDVFEIGITDYAQNSMWEIIYLQFFESIKKGYFIKENEAFCIVDSVKTSFEIFSPLSGEIVEINFDLQETIKDKSKNFSKNWLIKIKQSNKNSLESLMNEKEYKTYVSESNSD